MSISNEIKERLKEGLFDDDELVELIKSELLTQKQKLGFFQRDLEVGGVLHGYYTGKDEDFLEECFQDWNTKLGFHFFGSGVSTQELMTAVDTELRKHGVKKMVFQNPRCRIALYL